MNEELKNQYQINKTIRFGATLKNSDKKNKSHQELIELVDLSAEHIESKIESVDVKSEEELLAQISLCLTGIEEFYKSWSEIYYRTDQIKVTKDFYRILAKKARFDRVKQSSSSINLYLLQKESVECIVAYWKDNLIRQEKTRNAFYKLLKQYNDAIKMNTANEKPNLITFRKMFLSLLNLVNEVLIPISNHSISFTDIDILTDRDKHISEFATESRDDSISRSKLLGEIQNLKEYMNTQGGYTRWANVTLNSYTSEQKPNDFNRSINVAINELKIVELVNKLKGKKEQEIQQYFVNLNKKDIFKDRDSSVIERAQCFKYKPIPLITKNGLAKYLEKNENIPANDTLHVLDNIGIPKSIGLEYLNLKDNDKQIFNLNHYPIKSALDYAWETLAKYIKGNKKDDKDKFQIRQCVSFLNDFFDCDIETDDNFILYANLLYIKENLSALDGAPKSKKHHIDNIDSTFRDIKWVQNTKKHYENAQSILEWIKKSPNDQNKEIKSSSDACKKFIKAKKEIGSTRSGLKTDVKKVETEEFNIKKKKKCKIVSNPYTELTNTFKDISIIFGKRSAELRDKFREENELNKISHFGIVIEDDNSNNPDRYLLIKSIQKDNELLNEVDQKGAVSTILESLSDSGEFNAYEVKSLTSKALQKIIKNPQTYKRFHTSDKMINFNSTKRKWSDFDKNKREKIWGDFTTTTTTTINNDNQLLPYIVDCLKNSKMAEDQNWIEFGWTFEDCKSYEAIEHEINKKSYILKKNKISKKSIEQLVEDGCLLLPIINQDITSEHQKDRNQFSKDWQLIFDNRKDFRLHPEFRIAYRTPTDGYAVDKRYGRFQLIVHFNCEFIPQGNDYINQKQLLARYNEPDEQQKAISDFNIKINKSLKDDYVVIGIDRGIKQLTTLAVLDKDGKIIGDFDIYKRTFNKVLKQWEHVCVDTRHILDLSNLRVETTVEGNKVLVDLSLIKVKKDRNTPGKKATLDNRQKIKLKELSYIRKLQFQMLTEEATILKLPDVYADAAEFEHSLSGEGVDQIISPYGEGENYADLPIDKMWEMILEFKKIFKNDNNQNEKDMLIELDAADDLKRGVVANMIGVVHFILAKYNYNAYISLENLSRAWGGATDGLSGRYLPGTNQDKDMDFKKQQTLMLAGLGTYQFFEMQLLKKLSKIQKEHDIFHYVPPFRSKDNYENIMQIKEVYEAKPFGIVHFIYPQGTSSKCPVCGEGKINRNLKQANIVRCKEEKCGFISIWSRNQLENITPKTEGRIFFNPIESEPTLKDLISNNRERIKQYDQKGKNLHYIRNGDDNGAYHIAKKTVDNLLGKKS